MTTTKDAADAIIEAVGLACPQSELLTNEAQPSGQYLRFHVPGRFPLPDEVEFLVRNTGVSGRNFDADEGAGLTVTLRSIAGTVQCAWRAPARALHCAAKLVCACARLRLACRSAQLLHRMRNKQVLTRAVHAVCADVYPFMTPVSDGGLQKSRLTAIREQLAWRLVGCELIECYQ